MAASLRKNLITLSLFGALTFSVNQAEAFTAQFSFTKAPVYGPSPAVIYPFLYVDGQSTQISLQSIVLDKVYTYTSSTTPQSLKVSYGMGETLFAPCTLIRDGGLYLLTQTANGTLTCTGYFPESAPNDTVYTYHSNIIQAYSVAHNGALNLQSTTTVPSGKVLSLQVDPSGQLMYVITDNALLSYAVSNGAPVLVSNKAEVNPQGMMIQGS